MNKIVQDTELETAEVTAGSKLAPVRSLSVKLLMLTVFFIMLAEILIFVPSVANFRNVWLKTHIETAEAASIVFLDTTDIMLSEMARKNLLRTTQSLTVAVRREGRSQLIASASMPDAIIEHIDLDNSTAFGSIRSAFAMLFASPDSLYRVYGSSSSGEAVVELVQRVEFIQKAMWVYARNILLLSLLISVFAAGLVYLALYRMIVLPIVRISANMDAFSHSPEDASLIFKPTDRRDEIGLAEEKLAAFQADLRNTLRQKQHLADLGLAVSKINHDLRNILASAQLFSDRLTTLPDPTVQRFAPKLVRTIDRAVDYTTSVMAYGKALETPPKIRRLMLHPVVTEVGELLGLDQEENIVWQNEVDSEFEADADPEQLLRILLNLCRNAKQAMSDSAGVEGLRQLSVAAENSDGAVNIHIMDTGPGIPDDVASKIFKAFEGSTRSGGTGLGMSIALELVKAHGGEISMEKTGPDGTHFRVTIPLAARDGVGYLQHPL